MRTTSSVSIPVIRASSGLSEVARIALPIRVRVSSRWTSSISTTVPPMISRCFCGMRSGDSQATGGWMPVTIGCSCTPQKNCMAERIISIRPKLAMTSMIVGARRNGL